MRKLLAAVASVGLLAGLMAGPVAASGFPDTVDIDSNGDCEIEGVADDGFVNGSNVHVTINRNWIIATCHTRLTADELTDLGGPYASGHVHRDFDCVIGDNDGLDDIEATQTHGVITPSSWLQLFCKAPIST